MTKRLVWIIDWLIALIDCLHEHHQLLVWLYERSNSITQHSIVLSEQMLINWDWLIDLHEDGANLIENVNQLYCRIHHFVHSMPIIVTFVNSDRVDCLIDWLIDLLFDWRYHSDVCDDWWELEWCYLSDIWWMIDWLFR